MVVESEHYACFMTRHVMKHAFTSNLHKINNANGENTAAINNKALSMPKLPYYFLKCIKSAMKMLRHR